MNCMSVSGSSSETSHPIEININQVYTFYIYSCNSLHPKQLLPGNCLFYGDVFKLSICGTCTYSNRIRKNTIFFKSLEVKTINEIIVITYKLTNNFAGLITSGLGADMVSEQTGD
jgi:hypothetical protein